MLAGSHTLHTLPLSTGLYGWMHTVCVATGGCRPLWPPHYAHAMTSPQPQCAWVVQQHGVNKRVSKCSNNPSIFHPPSVKPALHPPSVQPVHTAMCSASWQQPLNMLFTNSCLQLCLLLHNLKARGTRYARHSYEHTCAGQPNQTHRYSAAAVRRQCCGSIAVARCCNLTQATTQVPPAAHNPVPT